MSHHELLFGQMKMISAVKKDTVHVNSELDFPSLSRGAPQADSNDWTIGSSNDAWAKDPMFNNQI